MRIAEKERISSIKFGGMIFMYGNVMTELRKEGDKAVIDSSLGNDGNTDIEKKKEISIEAFNKLVEEICNIDFMVKPSEEDKCYIASDMEGFEKQWALILSDSEGELITCIKGYDSFDPEFEKIAQVLIPICPEFQDVEKLFEM